MLPTKTAVMILLPTIVFLILLLSPRSESGCLGGGFFNKSCPNNVKYVSDVMERRPKGKRKICLDKEKLYYSSDLSEIYSGWFWDDKGKRQFAIKKYNNQKRRAKLAYENSVRIFHTINKQFPDEAEHKLLITADEWGHTVKNNEPVIAMEFAGQDLNSYLSEQRPDFSDDNSMRAMIRSLAQPLALFHREVGIHLDVKPANFLYAETGEFLKLNDFDGSHAFEFKTDVPKKKRANWEVQIDFDHLMHTANYSSPELYRADCGDTVTTKSDIWSLGMSIYVVLLLQSKYGLDNKGLGRVRKFLVGLFRQRRFASDPSTHAMDLEWLLGDDNLDSFEMLLKIRHDFPDTFHLFNNLLSQKPRERMSARGVVNYTEGKCRPKIVNVEAEDILLFGNVTAKSLMNMLTRELPGDGDTRTSLEMRKKQLNELLVEALSKQKQRQQQAVLANRNDDTMSKLPKCQTN